MIATNLFSWRSASFSLFIFSILAVSISACGGGGTTESKYHSYSGYDTMSYSGDSSGQEFDEDEAIERAKEDLDYETYSSIGMPYGCTDDCAGHEAGFEWAKSNEITDGLCGGNSQSFIEGCEAYSEAIEERVDEYRYEFEE